MAAAAAALSYLDDSSAITALAVAIEQTGAASVYLRTMPGHGEQVSLERLLQLLDQGEGVDLDFKATCDLNERGETVAITKDIAAFSAAGGHIVIGVAEDGGPSGLFGEEQAKLFDEATLRSKIAPRYLPQSISITNAVHDFDGRPVVLVYVAQHVNGFVVTQSDGAYTAPNGKQSQEFRAGDVFVRRGSSSVPWNQAESDEALDRAMATRKEQWREELRDDLTGLGIGAQAQQIARGPAANFTWQLDNDAFSATLIELLRADDDVAITIGFDAMSRGAGQSVATGAMDDLRTVLDRVASAAAIGVAVHRRAVLDQAIQTLVQIYNLGFDSSGFPRGQTGAVRAAELWLEVITRVYSVGALAVRRCDWPAVKKLTLQKGSGQDFAYYPNWLRHALTEASRAGALQTREGDRQVELSLLQMAADHVERLAALRPDVAAGDEAILDSLTQFDLLSIFTAIADAGTIDDRAYYTNFARFNWSRSEPALIQLLEDDDVRMTLVPLEPAELAAAIREVSRLARAEGFRFSAWPGWDSAVIEEFLKAHPQDDRPS